MADPVRNLEASLPGPPPYSTARSFGREATAACAQVFNLMVEGHAPRTCRREGCERIFVHQLGRSEYRKRKNRDDALYCSASCAQTQASRDYRRRKAARQKEQR